MEESCREFDIMIKHAVLDVLNAITHDAWKILLAQVVNDLSSILNVAIDGDGRAAIRTARSGFEHLLNLYDFLDSPELRCVLLFGQVI